MMHLFDSFVFGFLVLLLDIVDVSVATKSSRLFVDILPSLFLIDVRYSPFAMLVEFNHSARITLMTIPKIHTCGGNG